MNVNDRVLVPGGYAGTIIKTVYENSLTYHVVKCDDKDSHDNNVLTIRQESELTPEIEYPCLMEFSDGIYNFLAWKTSPTEGIVVDSGNTTSEYRTTGTIASGKLSFGDSPFWKKYKPTYK